MLRTALGLLAPPLCWGCHAPCGTGQPLCPRCRLDLRWLPAEPVAVMGLAAWAPLAYEGAARQLVLALKRRGALATAETMAAQMAAGAPAVLLAGPPALVPVPCDGGRRRRRGFSHTLVIARELATRTGLELVDCLARSRGGARQAGRGRAERLLRTEPVALRDGARAPPSALLLDDVVTTGATLRSCADALRGGGTLEVRAIAYARTLPR